MLLEKDQVRDVVGATCLDERLHLVVTAVDSLRVGQQQTDLLKTKKGEVMRVHINFHIP